ncbi:MAG: amino acid adenylation domain-containing protein, partial [Bacteroidales bacterium]|nr:amino acid adenylation domain-containing protein [Bacteroidales bacterium]
MEILKKEVFGYYNGIEQEPLRIQYKDYAVWQNGFVQRYETEKKKAYWINEFKEEIPVLNLPLDYPRSPANSAEAGVLSFALDEKLVSCIKKLSAKEGISPFMFLLAVYNIVIHKYTQQDDIVIGVTTLGRDSQDLSRLIGMFVNNLPVRSKPEDQLTVGNYLKQIKQKLFDSFANQDYPFDELVESLNIVRDITRSPLFDVVFSYMNFELSGMKNSEISISDYRSGISLSSEYDLMLYGLEAQERIYFTIKYKKALFRKESIQKFANHFTQAATIAAGNSDIRISELDIILPAERERILSLNDGTLQISSKPDVLEFFEKAVTLNPDGIAVTHKENRLTYRELDELSNKVANWLRDKCGVRPDDLVGIMVERTEQMIVAILGVIKSGAAYVGIDTAYPVKRVEYILKDSRAKVLLTENHILRNISLPDEVDAIIEDIRSQEIAGSSSSQPVNVNLPENIAYVIYTSGTTGDPKGVTITRGNLSLFLQWCLHDYGENSYQIAYATSSYCFDISVFEIFYTLITGKTIKVLKSAMEIPSNATADKDILIMTVPSLFAEIKEELLKKGIDNISLINLGGEQIPHGLLDGIDCDRIEVRNLYGPSEDTTFTTFYKFSNTNRKTLIGRPVANTRIYITDKYLKLVPEGHSGEICIAGEKLSKGYLYKDHLTREKFVNNPYGNGLIYKTGDLGRWTSSGDLEYLGRIDRQVKIHGYRIELGEIETCIRTCPSVENVAVTVYRKDGDKEIAAYIVLNKQTEMKDIKEFLSQNLPSFMIPLYFVVMDKIPLTPNGKVDISALPEPGVVGITDRSDHTENNKPVNPVEIRLASVWKKVLEREEISRSDNFFDLGGHSLKAIRLLSAINREFVTEFRLSDVFDYPTIAGFSKIISDRESEPEADIVNREAKTAGREAETVRKETEKVRREAESVSLDTEAADKRRTIVPLEKAEWYEVSYAQRRLWTIDRVEEKSFAYNVPVVYHVKSRIDTDALQKAFEALIFKYESFRTAFIEVDGDPKQVITDKAEFKIKVIEIPSGEDIKTGSREHVINAVKESFDLRVAPLLKVTLIRYPAGDESVMVINIHHIIVDEWSVGILAENLALFYNHFTGIEPVTDRKLFNPDEIQYKDYAAWHNSQLQENSPLAMEGEKFWMEMFSDPVEPLNLPADYKRPKVQTFKGQTVDFVLPPEISSALRQLSSDNNSTLFITTLALFNVLFYKYTGQKDIVIGTPVASRDAYEIKDQIGFFLNTIALRNKLVDSQNFNEFLAGVRDNTLKAYNNQSYPFDRLVEKVLQSRDLSRSPLFDVMLISQTPERNSGEMFKGVNMELMESEYQASKFDLSVSYCDDGSEIKYFFEYNTSIYREESIRNMFRHYMTMLEDLLGNPGKTLYSLSMISAQEKEELLALSAGNNRTLAEKSVVSLIEKQAAEFGNRTAVIFKRKKLSYNELNSKANRLSGILNNEMGVTPGDIVCVMLDRSEWSVISLLAILKAGAVYLPVDPLYPASRIRYIFEDCKGKVLITSDNHSSLLSGLYNGKIITTEQIEERAEQYGSDNPESGIDISCSQAAPAYIIYTSGSTGEPKGVIGTHKCLLNLMVWQGELLETELRILQYAPHSFDVSVQEMVFSMASAATLYMTDQDTRFKMQVIADLIEKEEIQMVTMPFSALNLFLEENEDPGKLKSLKHLVTSGEQPYMNDN